MTDRDELRIALSRKKLVGMGLGALLFVVAGVWMLSADFSGQHLGVLGLPFVRRGIGVLGLGFFGVIAVFIARKMFDTRPGLVLSARGFVDNSSGLSRDRLVPWTRVTGFSVFQFGSSRSIVVHLDRPDAWIEGNALRRRMLQANLRLCGSPMAIAPVSLDIGFDELLRTLEAWHARFGGGANAQA